MKNFKKRNFKIAILTGIISLVVMYLLSLLRYGYQELATNDDHRIILFAFIPIWATGLAYCGYGLSKKFFTQKTYFLGENFDEATEDKIMLWKNHKRFMYSNVFNVIGKLLIMLLPVYVIAFIDESKYLASNLVFIILLAVIGTFSLVMSRYLKKNYEKYSD